MLNLIKMLLMAVFELLPDDPFREVIDGIVYDVDFLPTLNWFVPFDICSTMLLGWLDCMVAYYVFIVVKKIVMDYIIGLAKNLTGALAGGVTTAGK